MTPPPSPTPPDGPPASLAEPMRSRWSPSIFDAEHVASADDVATLLGAAQWAPSWGNRQPASWLVAPRGTAAHAAVVATLSRGNSGWVPRASLVLVGAVTTTDGSDDAASAEFAAYDLGQAAAHVTLQAQTMGLHTHQFAGFDRAALATALAVPDDVRLMVGMAVGVRGDPAAASERDRERERRVRGRRGLAELTHTAPWSRPWTGPGAEGCG